MELEMHMDEYLPLRDVVFNTLRRAILKGELKPGERLMEITWQTSWVSAAPQFGRPFVSWNWQGWWLWHPEKGRKWRPLQNGI